MTPATSLPAIPAPANLTKAEHFQIFRDYIKNEGDLTHQRISWNLTIQGLLFAGYALIEKITAPKAQALEHIIPWLGVALSIFVESAVIAAAMALSKLTKDWRDTVSPNYPTHPYLPDIVGGGAKYAHYLGLIPPLAIPACFAAAWVGIFFWH